MHLSTLFIGSDHGGFSLRAELVQWLAKEFPSLQVQDCGTFSEASTDYPQIAAEVAQKVASSGAFGILLCGSGIGVAIAANKVAGVRAATVWDATSARLCRAHNDANILCLGARLLGLEVAREAVRAFLKTPFEGGRHAKRVEMIVAMEGVPRG